MKNNRPFEMPVAAETARFPETYIRDWRPLLHPGDDIFLFPAGQGNRGGHRSVDTIRKGVVSAVAEQVGVKMRAHDFRAFTAALLLEDSPGAPGCQHGAHHLQRRLDATAAQAQGHVEGQRSG